MVKIPSILLLLLCGCSAFAALTIRSTLPCAIEDSTNLIAWEPLVTFTGTGDTLTVSPTDMQRFFRSHDNGVYGWTVTAIGTNYPYGMESDWINEVFTTNANPVKLAWNASTDPDTIGYRIYFRHPGGRYFPLLDCGNVTSIAIPAEALRPKLITAYAGR